MLRKGGQSFRRAQVNISLGDSRKSPETSAKAEAVKTHTSKIVLPRVTRKKG